MRDIVIENIRGAHEKSLITKVNRVDPDIVTCMEEDPMKFGGNSDESDDDNYIIFLYFIATAVIAGILRHLSDFRKNKNIYMMKSKIWRDEDGFRLAVAATVSRKKRPNNSILEGSTQISNTIVEKKELRTNEGDLWLLLMSESEPNAAEDSNRSNRAIK